MANPDPKPIPLPTKVKYRRVFPGTRRPRGANRRYADAESMPVQIATRITVRTRKKVDKYLSWIQDPETYAPQNLKSIPREDLEQMPHSISQLTDRALAYYTDALLAGFISPEHYHTELMAEDDKRRARIHALPKQPVHSSYQPLPSPPDSSLSSTPSSRKQSDDGIIRDTPPPAPPSPKR